MTRHSSIGLRFLAACWILAATLATRSPAAQLSVGPVNFEGNRFNEPGTNSNLTPPNTNGYAGPNHYIEFTNGTFAVFNKSDGTLATAKISDSTFWSSAGVSVSPYTTSDPRIVYDTDSQRWIASQVTLAASNNAILVAVSVDSNPLHGFNAVQIANAPPIGDFADFDTLSVNHDSVIIGASTFNADGSSYLGEQLFNIPKASLLAATPSTTGLFKTGIVTSNGFTLQGVNDFTGLSNRAKVLAVDPVTVLNALSSTALKVSTVTNPAGGGTALGAAGDVTVASYITSHDFAAQPGSPARPLDSGDSRIGAAVFDVAGKIYLAHDIDVNFSGTHRSGIQWVVLDDTTNAVISQGVLSNSNFDYIYPAIAANAAGDVVLGFTESGPATFLSTAAALGTTDGLGMVTFQSPLVTRAGTVTYDGIAADFNPARWGDFSAINVDPNNPKIFWTVQEFESSSSTWSTQITQLVVTPEPSSLILLSLAGLGLFVCMVRRRSRLMFRCIGQCTK